MMSNFRLKRKAVRQSSSDSDDDAPRSSRSQPTSQSRKGHQEPVAGPSRRTTPGRGEPLTRNQIAREMNSQESRAGSSWQSQSNSQSRGTPSVASSGHRNRVLTPELSDQEENGGATEPDEGEEDPDETESLCKYLLAGIMRADKMTEPQLQRLLQRCCKELHIENVGIYTTEEGVSNLIKKIQNNLKSINLVVKALKSELNGKTLYYFGPLKGNEALKFQNNWNKHDPEMFGRWVKYILRSDRFQATARELYVATRDMKGKRDADTVKKLIDKLVDMGYLEKANDDDDDDDDDDEPLTLGIRTIDEFTLDIMKLFPEALVACQLCQGTLLHGCECSALNCKNALHFACWEKYKVLFPGNLTCPRSSNGCDRNWEQFPPEKRRRFDNEQEPVSDEDEEIHKDDDQQRCSDLDGSD